MSTTFSKEGAQRIVNVVRRVERSRNLARQARGPRASSLARSEFIRWAGKKIAIGGIRKRFVWVYYTENPVRAEWSGVDSDTMPDGVEIFDTHVQEIHIPRLG